MTRRYYKSLYIIPDLNRIIQVSDGCADQYKSKYVMNLLSGLCDRMGIDEVVFSYHATAGGKCAVDALGNGGKVFIFRREVWGTVRCADGFEVSEEITGENGMQQPIPPADVTKKTISIRC